MLPTGVKRVSLYWIEDVFTTDISIYQEDLFLTAITSIDVIKEEHMDLFHFLLYDRRMMQDAGH